MMKKVLVVDDDESIVEVLQIVLEGEGYNVQTSLNGLYLQTLTRISEADRAVEDAGTFPNLILLDVLLSGEDGRELCRQLKSSERTKHIPVIMLSAHSDAGKVADNSGADAFLEKPFDVDELIAVVQQHLPSISSSGSNQSEHE